MIQKIFTKYAKVNCLLTTLYIIPASLNFTSIIQGIAKFIVNPEIKNKIYQVMLSKPSLTQREIAEEVGVHESTVSRVIRSLTKSNDYQIAAMAAGMFIQEFANAAEFWQLQITELEKLKERTEDPKLKLKIVKEQSDRYENILVLARQGELIQSLRKLNRNNKPELQRAR